jgi:hypothetical protein
MKLKNLSDLSEAYSKVAAISVDQQKVVTENKADFILNTDVTQYLSENVNKPGQALGGGPGTGKGGMIEPLAKKTGPVGLKGNNFKEVDHKADPGSDAKVMKKEEEHDEPASENDYEEFALLRKCDHYIIANSSFSWWGSWLSLKNPNKIVIAPKEWFGPDGPQDYYDIYTESMIKI